MTTYSRTAVFAPDCLASIRSRGKTGGPSPGSGNSLQLQTRSSRRRTKRKGGNNPRLKKVANHSLVDLRELKDSVVKPTESSVIDLRSEVTLATSAF